MNPNVGNIDRVVRALVGIALIIWAVTGGPVWAWIGVVVLATSVFKFCPIYKLIGFNSGAAK